MSVRRQAALADDVATLMPLKECDRAFKRAFGRGEHEPGDSYTDLKNRLIEQLYEEDLAEEQAIQRRIKSLRENVRREVVDELADVRAEQTATAAALEDREHAVTAREKPASPPYRARFVAAGAFLALSGDVLIRLVA